MADMSVDIPPRNMKKHLITIGMKDDEKSNRTIPRNRLLLNQLNKIWKIDIEFLLDQFGEVLYPEQWMTECQGKPYTYSISAKQQAPPTEDANIDPDYMGDASVFIEMVPMKVDQLSLEAWLKQGVQSETSQIEKMRKHLAKGMATVRGIEAKLQEVPFLDVKADNEKEAAAARKEIASLLEREVAIWEKKIIERRKQLAKFENATEDMQLMLEIFEHDPKSNTNTWLCIMESSKRKLASKLCRKTDWSEYKLAIMQKGFMGEKDSPPLVLYGRRAEFPMEYEDDRRVVNMRLVRVCRRRHGDGAYIHEDVNEMRITPNWYYRGDFRFGQRHGIGECHTYCSKYSGEFEHDLARDDQNGSFFYADGSKWHGSVGRELQHSASLLKGNEYASGVPHGNGKFQYSDGSMYTGMMFNGTVQGNGLYQDVHCGTAEGTFKRGMLNGKSGCKVERYSKEFTNYIQEGGFVNDAPNGTTRMTLPLKKKQKNVNIGGEKKKNEIETQAGNVNDGDKNDRNKNNGDREEGQTEYVGQFVDGVRHGLIRGSGGKEEESNRWIYEGFYCDGHREGLGEELYESKVRRN